MNTVGEVIKRLREERGWSLRDLAEKTGLSHQAINLRERGASRVKISEEPLFAGAFGLELDTFRSMFSSAPDFHAGLIPVLNRAPVGSPWDYEVHPGGSRDGRYTIPARLDEDASELICLEIVDEALAPALHKGDLLVLWQVAPSVPRQSIDDKIVYAEFTEASGGGAMLGYFKLTGKVDPHKGMGARIVKANGKGRELWTGDIKTLARAKRVSRNL